MLRTLVTSLPTKWLRTLSTTTITNQLCNKRNIGNINSNNNNNNIVNNCKDIVNSNSRIASRVCSVGSTFSSCKGGVRNFATGLGENGEIETSVEEQRAFFKQQQINLKKTIAIHNIPENVKDSDLADEVVKLYVSANRRMDRSKIRECVREKDSVVVCTFLDENKAADHHCKAINRKAAKEGSKIIAHRKWCDEYRRIHRALLFACRE